MKWQFETLRALINETVGMKTFDPPMGFSRVDDFDRDAKSTLARQGAQPGMYNDNNGSIVAITSQGPFVYVHTGNPHRRVSFEQAIASLKKAGYRLNNRLFVPMSNE